MSKAAQIMSLYDGVRSTKEIAQIVGCADSYVRVVARQRKGGSCSEIDRRYLNSERGHRYTAKRLPKSRAYAAVKVRTGDRAAAASAYRDAYRQARLRGKTIKEASAIATRCWYRVISETYDRAAARVAYARAGSEA